MALKKSYNYMYSSYQLELSTTVIIYLNSDSSTRCKFYEQSKSCLCIRTALNYRHSQITVSWKEMNYSKILYLNYQCFN